jgi:hypothetical protein
MRRPRVLQLLTVVGLAGVLAASGCGVLADDTAATVGDTVIPASLVNQLVADDPFMAAMAQQALDEQTPGVVEGSSARQVLSFLISSEVLSQEVARWGAEVTDADTQDAEASIDEQAPDLKGRARDVVLRFLVDRAALQARLGEIDQSSDDDLRRIYDGIPSYWDQVCLTAVVVPADGVADAKAALAGGTDLADVVDEVQDASLAATADRCLPTEYLPEALRSAVAGAREGRVVGPVEDAIEGRDSVIWFRVESTQVLSFDDARDQLTDLAGSIAQQGVEAWLNIKVNQDVTIDPQYGSGASVSQNGLTVLAPETPIGAAPPAGSLDGVTGGAAGATP